MKGRCSRCGARNVEVRLDSALEQDEICALCQQRQDELEHCFATWDEVSASTPPEPEWVLPGYLAKGAVTLLAGRPKAGKSTLAWAIAAVVDMPSRFGGRFLGRPVMGGPVVYVAEEGAATLAPKLGSSDESLVLSRDKAWPKPSWVELIGAAVSRAKEIEAALLVIDSLAFWASFREGQEQDSGAVQKVMDMLSAAASGGLAVLLVHHQRKRGGDQGDAVRGSGAILGAVDVVVELEHLGEGSPPTHRRLVAVGRWPQTPPVLVIDRAEDGWRVVREVEDRSAADALGIRERVLAALPDQSPGITEADLLQRLDLDKRKVGLRALFDKGLVDRKGAGKKGDPYLYKKVSQKGVPASDTIHPGNGVVPPFRADTISGNAENRSGTPLDTNAKVESESAP